MERFRMIRPDRRTALRLFTLLMLTLAATSGYGCGLEKLVGGMAASYARTGTHKVAYEYGGLQGKTFAVLVTAGKDIQYEYPWLTNQISEAISLKLASEAGASGFVPAATVNWYQSRNPQWEALSYSEISKALGVERLIIVDIYEYRLHQPGNPYLWDGVVAGQVGVVEADSSIPDEFIYEKDVQVAYPGKPGFGPSDMSRQDVITRLDIKFVRDVCWLFYDHEEPNYED